MAQICPVKRKRLRTLMARRASRRNGGVPSRGASLLHFLKHHPELVAGKDILHIAPEDELRSWLRSTTRSI